jgi:hypothetical protein
LKLEGRCIGDESDDVTVTAMTLFFVGPWQHHCMVRV